MSHFYVKVGLEQIKTNAVKEHRLNDIHSKAASCFEALYMLHSHVRLLNKRRLEKQLLL